jgi:hypothetical protein
MAKHANQKLRETLRELPTNPVDIAPDEYEWYVPSFGDTYIGSAINRQPRWVGKGDFDLKGLAATEGDIAAMDPEIRKILEESLADDEGSA